MTIFPERPIIQAVEGSDSWWILKDTYVDRKKGITIKEGFRFDGASIPRFAWRIVGHPLQGNVLPAALLHDAKYKTQYISKDIADVEFFNDMGICGVNFPKRCLFYLAVKFFGNKSWKHDEATIGLYRDKIEVEGL